MVSVYGLNVVSVMVNVRLKVAYAWLMVMVI